MPADHFSLTVPQQKLDGLASFLITSLQHMGFKEWMRPIPTVVGMGDATPFLWITGIDISDADLEVANKFYKGQHTAFMAKNSGEVDQFYAAALKAGATDNGPPGPRPGYPKGYYTAFVIDPVCGINFEVVYNGDGA